MTLEVRNLSKRFPGTLAVNDVTFEARAGEVTGFLGPNGSGKSTTLRSSPGSSIPPEERLSLTAGRSAPISSLSSPESATCRRSRISTRISAAWSICTWSANYGICRRAPQTERIEGCSGCCRYTVTAMSPFRRAPKGMRQKVLLSAALLHNPDLLLLDEPFSGLDVATGLVLRRLVQELAAAWEGRAVQFT